MIFTRKLILEREVGFDGVKPYFRYIVGYKRLFWSRAEYLQSFSSKEDAEAFILKHEGEFAWEYIFHTHKIKGTFTRVLKK